VTLQSHDSGIPDRVEFVHCLYALALLTWLAWLFSAHYNRLLHIKISRSNMLS